VKARALLAKALTRRGLALSGGGVALVLTQSAAAVPVPLLSSTMKAASAFAAGPAAAGLLPVKVVALTEGVLKAMSMNKTKTVLVALFAAGLLTFAGLLPSALPQSPSPQSKDKQDDINVTIQRDAATAAPFLEVGKIYEFTPASSKWGPFQGKVLAMRGEQWVRVVDMQGEGKNGAGSTWVNLNQMAFITDATASEKNRKDVQRQ